MGRRPHFVWMKTAEADQCTENYLDLSISSNCRSSGTEENTWVKTAKEERKGYKIGSCELTVTFLNSYGVVAVTDWVLTTEVSPTVTEDVRYIVLRIGDRKRVTHDVPSTEEWDDVCTFFIYNLGREEVGGLGWPVRTCSFIRPTKQAGCFRARWGKEYSFNGWASSLAHC